MGHLEQNTGSSPDPWPLYSANLVCFVCRLTYYFTILFILLLPLKGHYQKNGRNENVHKFKIHGDVYYKTSDLTRWMIS